MRISFCTPYTVHTSYTHTFEILTCTQLPKLNTNGQILMSLYEDCVGELKYILQVFVYFVFTVYCRGRDRKKQLWDFLVLVYLYEIGKEGERERETDEGERL